MQYFRHPSVFRLGFSVFLLIIAQLAPSVQTHRGRPRMLTEAEWCNNFATPP